jgi:restriction system protein
VNESNPDDILAAFELLLEAVEIEIDLIDRVGAKAFERHDHQAARETAEHAAQTTVFREKVLSLRKEWETLAKIHYREQRRDYTRSAT